MLKQIVVGPPSRLSRPIAAPCTSGSTTIGTHWRTMMARTTSTCVTSRFRKASQQPADAHRRRTRSISFPPR